MQTTKLARDVSSLHPNGLSRLAVGTLNISLYLLFALFTTADKANAHEFEDGFVERSVAVVVRNNVARLSYSIGLNPRTRQQLIEFWQSTEAPEGEIQDGFKGKSGSGSQMVDFFQLAAKHISRRLAIVVDREQIEPRIVSALPSSRHHVDVTVVLEFNLPTVDGQPPIAIEITDGNFLREKTEKENTSPEAPTSHDSVAKLNKPLLRERHLSPAPFSGGFRYAFKTAGSTVLTSSNVASILIRADRHLDDNFTDEQLDTAFKIKAKVANIHGTQRKQ